MSEGSWVVLLMLPLNVLVHIQTDSKTYNRVLLDLSCQIRKQEKQRVTSTVVWNDSSGMTHAPDMILITAPVKVAL